MALIGYIIVFYGFLADEFIFDVSMTLFDLIGSMTIFIVTISVIVIKLKS